MPDSFGANGLTVKTRSEILTDLTTAMRNIYGSDINVDQNSPDGQLLNIFAQALVDLRELIVQVNSGFDPDQAIDEILNQRVVINNIERRGATFTITPVTVTVTTTVTLAGLDAVFDDINGTGFTVQDNAGNEFILIDTQTLTAGAHVLNFRAKAIGRVETTVNTITNQKTVVLGVSSVNNPSAALELGANAETNLELRTRRQQSVALASFGYLNGILASILSVSGVTDAVAYENATGTTDAYGTPPYTIWLVVEGGANTEIANVIYSKKSYGAPMRGAVSVTLTTPSGQPFVAKFDRPTAEDLYLRFDIQPTTGNSFDTAALKTALVAALSYTIGQFAETAAVTVAALTALVAQGGGGVPVNVEISANGSVWVDYLEPLTPAGQFVLDTSRITITII